MFGSTILEMAISLVFVYFLLSLVCTAFNEWVARMLALRSRTLEAGIKNLLSDPNFDDKAKELYQHPIIKGLYKQGTVDKWLRREGKPSYIPAQHFALALMDTVFEDPETGRRQPLDQINDTIANLEPKDLRKVFQTLMDQADNELDKFQEDLEEWFDASMERVSGWYARHMGIITLCFALLVTLFANADTVMMAKHFSGDNALRAAVVEAAGEWVTESNQEPDVSIKEIQEEAAELNLPLGWELEPLPTSFDGWMLKIVGLLITTLALSLGAPFWFDVLNKLVNMRRTGKVPEDTTESKPQISFSYEE